MSASGSTSVERLRIWLLAGAGLLVLVIAAFVGYAHYRASRLLTELPHKLGIDIEQETTGFTYSQSDGPNGRTIYTIHASKAVQRKNGKVNLHDVVIALYGQGRGNQNRVDRISGDEFEYDQNAGVARAVGEVHIDLQAPTPTDATAKAEYAKGKNLPNEAESDEHLIHVTTSGLVFAQKLAVAATQEELEFKFGAMTGHAHGAEYDSDSGQLILQSAIQVNGLKDGEPVKLTADHVEMSRQREQVTLSGATYSIGGASKTRVAKASKVTAYLRQDGSIERAVGENGVSLAGGDGAMLTARQGEMHLNKTNQPQDARFSGAMRYVAGDLQYETRGEANEGKAEFDAHGLLQHVLLHGGVHLQERLANADSTTSHDERDLTANELNLAMRVDGGKRVEVREAVAAGDAKLTTTNQTIDKNGPAKNNIKKQSTELSADLLKVLFAAPEGSSAKGAYPDRRVEVRSVEGTGHTLLRRQRADGFVEISSGDTLNAVFRDGDRNESEQTKGLAVNGAEKLASAVQEGNVTMVNRPAAKPGNTAVNEQRGAAERAAYDGDADKLTLTGGVQLNDGNSALWADRVELLRRTGDGTALGSVRANYLQTRDSTIKNGEAAEPVHVLAARSEFKHDAREATFYGTTGKPARLWQGGSQIEAPVLKFDEAKRRLVAYGNSVEQKDVHAVFANSFAKPAREGGKTETVRVESNRMIYDDTARRGDFTGGVKALTGDGTIAAQAMTVYLKADDAAKPMPAQNTFLGAGVDHVAASGEVIITQPGRRATGEQLVYTAADELVVMTGRSGVPPKMMDEAQGAITGGSLSFHAGDNRVVVSNGPDGAFQGQRVRTETRVKQ